jgi:hypothetical protein
VEVEMRKTVYDNSISIKEVTKDFNLLIQGGIVGFYNRCEVIQIFGLKNGMPFNIFTLVTFEKSDEISEIEEFITSKLSKFDGIKDVKWGISRNIISIERCKDFFYNLSNDNIFSLSTEKLEIGKLSFTKKQYIPPVYSLEEIQLNNILKNNFNNGSYVIEAFDLKKNNVDFLINDPLLLNKFSESISCIIPIRIGALSDRLGNVIFQFPVRIFETEMSVMKPDKGFTLKLIYDNEIKQIPKLNLLVFNKFEDSTMDFKILEIEEEAEVIVSTSNNVDLKVIDPKNNLILSANLFSTLKNFNFDMGISSSQNRVFKINNNQYEVSINSRNKFSVFNQTKGMEEWILERKYDQELKALERSKSFIQYYGNQGEKALNDIRDLIKIYGKKGVFLWDPYLNAIDIKNTLYYTPYSYVPLKAITNLKDPNCSNKSDIIQGIRKEFNSDDLKYLFINLELRSKIGTHGWDFHDRFIIFPLERPKVWSLGISVNQLGKSHHILQEVKNAQHILNAFNKLWDELDNEECLVWRSM